MATPFMGYDPGNCSGAFGLKQVSSGLKFLSHHILLKFEFIPPILWLKVMKNKRANSSH